MAIKQLSVFLANQPGVLSEAVRTISDAGINIRALSLADTKDFGILRIIVSDVARTKQALSDTAVVAETPVVAVRMDDKAGALDEVLRLLGNDHINIEYIYAFTASLPDAAFVVLRVDDAERAEACLHAGGKQTLNDEDMRTLFS